MKYSLKCKYLLPLLFVPCIYSCTDNFKDYNMNETEVSDEMLNYDNLRVGGFIPQIQKDIIPTSDEGANEYQRAQNLAGDVYSGYMGAITGFNGNTNGTTYDFSIRWQDEAFSVAYTKVMPAWKKVAELSKGQNPSTYAFVQVLKVAAMHRITDMYGPIPYSKFGTGSLTTAYDSQEQVYNNLFEELNEAIEILEDFVSKYPNFRPLKKFDLMFGGDMSKCLKFANALKLRLAMRTVYVQPEKAKSLAEEAVKGLIMTENGDNVFLSSANGVSVFNPIFVCWNTYNDIRMGATIQSYLTGYNDSRIAKYFSKSSFDDVEYRGVRSGILINTTAHNNYKNYSSPNIFANTPVQIMTAAEVSFLRAEGALRGWNMGGTAQEFYEQGIRLSFAQWGAELGGYLADDESTPAPFEDAVQPSYSIKEGNPLLPTITVKWNESAGFEEKLERIITQKWLAVFPDGQEAWSEFRRTGYPKIFPVAVNKSGVVSTQEQIRRIPFPTTEYNNNRAEVEKAVGLLGGADNGGVKLWWDKK